MTTLLAQPHVSAWDFALAAAELAANTRCHNVVLLDMRGRSPVTEFFLIATGTSPRQIRTVADELTELGQDRQHRIYRTSGYETAHWILADFVNVVAHIFDPASRDFYDLELLWGDAPRIDWRKELGLPAEAYAEEALPPLDDSISDSADDDREEAQREEARLEGQDDETEPGDSDMDEDAELDAPIVTEVPDLAAGPDAVAFVEIDPPSQRRQRGKSLFPTPLKTEETDDRLRNPAEESQDEDQQERDEEAAADRDPEAVAAQDLPSARIHVQPLGGVSAGLSDNSMLDEDESPQRDAGEADEPGDNREEAPPAHEAAADAIVVPKHGRGTTIETTTSPDAPPPGRRRPVHRRAAKAPTASAPGALNPRRANAGVVKATPKPAARKPAARKPLAKKVAAKKPAAKKAPRAKPIAKQGPSKKPAQPRRKA